MVETSNAPKNVPLRRACAASLLMLLAFLAAAILLPTGAAAQSYPTRTVKIIENVGPGGTFDIFLRALANELQKRLGQPFIVDPRPGGNFLIAGRACAESPPDGYILCALSGETLVYADFLYKTVTYDPQHDLVPVTNLFFNTQVLVAHESLGIKSLQELPAVAKRKPLAFVAPAVAQRLFIERFNKQHGIDIVNIPFRGGGEALTGLLNGTTQIAFFGGANFAPLIGEGKLVGLAVDGPTRSPLFPQVPTLIELGYTERLNRNYFGVVAPKATPRPLVAQINQAIVHILETPEFRKAHLIDRALEPIGDSPDEFARFLQEDRESFAKLMKEANIQPQ
ncbi:MAG: Bug family tripartite tricarboxylate transporter substrate binding protein [Xanthobacteraceae bacterium]